MFFIAIATNVIFFGFGFFAPDFFIALLFLIPVEFLVGLLLLLFKGYRQTGGALLAASGVTLLLAGLVCSNTTFR